ncbi:MAG TPA: metallophosphoesterase, partial [Desertimonas sp.]|nr:metallophosphoesterase [Desertimonas sp.]
MTAGRRVAAFLLALPVAVTVPIAAAATPPSAPPTVRAVAITPTEVILEWEPGSPDVTSYTVRRDGAVLASVNPATLTFSDATVLAGRRYSYVVEAVSPGGTAATAAVRVKTPSPPERQDHNRPTVPEDVHAVALPDGSVLVDWQGSNDDSDISAYVIRLGNRHVATVNSGTLDFIDRSKGSAGGSYTVEAVDIAGLRSGRSDEAPVEMTTAGATAASPGTRTSGTAAQTGSLSTAAFSPSLRRYPYLTDVVNSADSTTGYATINWATDRSSTTAAAVWGAVAGDGSCSPTTSVAGTRTPITVNSVALYQWEANLTLLPDQAYCYRVTLGGADLLGSDPSPRFRTLLPTGSTTPFSFAVLGDWGQVDETSSNPDQANLMQRIAQSGVSFAVTTGDNAYASGSQGNYGDLVEVGPELSAIFGPQFWTVAGSSIPMYPAMGNHGFLRNDVAHPHFTNWPQDRAVSESNGRYQRDTYCCLLGTASLTLPSTWYAFDAGRTRIYVLQAAWSDSNGGVNNDPYEVDAAYQWTPSSAQYQWLQQDLAAHPNQIKMAAFHYPLYSDQKHETSDTFLHGPDSLQGLLNQYDVKLAFNGHAHIYQRNFADPGGTVAYLTGGGGAKTQSVAEDPCLAIDAYAIGWSNSSSTGNACGAATPPSSAAEVFHFLKVTVDGSQVTVEPINSLGQSFDVQTYDVGEPPPDTEAPSVPTGVSAVAASSSLVDVSWTASTDNVGVTGYDVLRDDAVIASVSGTSLTYADATVSASTTYSYQVVAKDLAGNQSGPSVASIVTTPAPSDTEAPSVPTGVSAVAASSSLVNVSWTASTDNVGVTGYDVLRDDAVIASVSGTTLTYADATVAASTTYSYQVVAKDLAGNHSDPSVASSVTTPAPSGPTTLSFVAAADSYTDATAAAANFGTATNVFADTSPAQRGYLRFVASGITGTVQSAVV